MLGGPCCPHASLMEDERTQLCAQSRHPFPRRTVGNPPKAMSGTPKVICPAVHGENSAEQAQPGAWPWGSRLS